MSIQNKFHVLFISSWFPNRINPFSGDFVQRHARAVSLTHRVTVLHVQGDFRLEKNEVIEHNIDENYRELIVYFPKTKFRFINFFRKFFAYQKEIRRVEYFDLIHANVMQYNLLWVLFQNIFYKKKYVVSEHWSAFQGELSFTQKEFAQIVVQNSSHIFPVSQYLKTAMEGYNLKGNYTVVPNVIMVKKFQPKESKHVSVKKFLHISNLREPVKNIRGMLEAAKILKEKGYSFEFHIGGNGDLSLITEFVERNDMENYVFPFGSLSHDEVSSKMKEADCFVVFSNFETQGIVILESFACGTPVIATRVGGIPENFPKNFGILVDKGDVTALVCAMEEVIHDKSFELPEKMHDFVAQKFSPEIVAKRFSEVYKTVLDMYS